jgi:hypothetical protein
MKIRNAVLPENGAMRPKPLPGAPRRGVRKKTRRFRGIVIAVGIMGLAAVPARVQQRAREVSPETREILAAGRIADAAARLKAFERIKAAHPQSPRMSRIEGFIFEAKVELAGKLEAILALQKSVVGRGRGSSRMTSHVQAALRILDHPRLKTFDKSAVLAAVLGYKDGAAKAATEPETFVSMSEKQEQEAFASFTLRAFDLLIARAQANAGDGIKALAALERFKAAGGETDAEFLAVLGDAYGALGKTEDAYGAYLGAAVENYGGAADKAKAMYLKLHGNVPGFEARLEALQKALPFLPQTFTPSKSWQGKAVLAEIFTGAECPPCVAAELGFGGLIDSYPAQYLAILEYHLPIPQPDPMMNPATKIRQDYYRINGAPTVIIDGDITIYGGGGRNTAKEKFRQYKAAIDSRVNAAPGLKLEVRAARAGDAVKADIRLNKSVPGVEVFVVLAQGEEKYEGSSGTVFHKLVVRDLVSIDPAVSKTATFDLAASERAADAYLTGVEKTYTRVPDFKFAERRSRIARDGLQVVVFAQETATKRVLNAVVGDVK